MYIVSIPTDERWSKSLCTTDYTLFTVCDERGNKVSRILEKLRRRADMWKEYEI